MPPWVGTVISVVCIVVACYSLANLVYSGWLTASIEKQLVWGPYHGLPAICHKLGPLMYIQSTGALKDYGLLQEIDLSGQEADEA